MPQKNIVVFYHHPCLDGSASAWVFDQKWGSDPDVELRYIPLEPGDDARRDKMVLDNISSDDECYFVDVVPSAHVLNHLPETCRVTVVDHHATNETPLKSVSKNIRVVFNAHAPSAAGLVWHEIFPELEPPRLIRWVEKLDKAIDLRGDEYPVADFMDVQDIRTLPSAFAVFATMEKMTDEEMAAQGRAYQAVFITNIEALEGSILFTRLILRSNGDPQWMPVVNADVQRFGRRISQTLVEIGNRGAFPGVAGAWTVNGDGKVTMSLRTNGFPHAGHIADYLARTLGATGGGHATMSKIVFNTLEEFERHVPLYTQEGMRKTQWTAQGIKRKPPQLS